MLRHAIALVLAASVVPAVLAGQPDKSGVSPNTVSLPTGPGSVEGLGESYQPALNTGLGRYQVPLTVPAGPAGSAPTPALHYEGGNGNGPLGFGWTLPLPFIQRQTDHGIPRYVDTAANGIDDDRDGEVDESDEVDRFVNEGKEELVLQPDGHYFCKIEGAFVRYRRQGDHWEGTLPDGTRLIFGLTLDGRVEDAATSRTFSWLLERKIDTRGNTTIYRYRSFPGEQDIRQKYLAEIAYGAGAPPWANFHSIVLNYESRTDWFEDGRPGFLVRTGQRLKEIIVATQGPSLAGHQSGDFNQDGTTDYLVRKYSMGYGPSDAVNSPWSLLNSVTPVGADGVTTLPPVRFGYTRCEPAESISASSQIIGGVQEPPQVMDNALVDLVDLNGDGLPDILKTERWGGAHAAYLNLGEVTNSGHAIRWSAAREVASQDGLAWNVNLESSDSIAHMADMDGDGRADLVQHSADGSVFYFPNTPTFPASNAPALPGWDRRRSLSNLDFAPPSPFGSDPDVRTADLDFDKRIDIIQSIPVAGGVDYRIWFNRGRQRYGRSQTVTPPRGFRFSQAGVQLTDVNGDRVPDVVSIASTELIVTAGMGHGLFASPMSIRVPGYTFESEQIGKARLQDLNGDGLADLVVERAAPGELWYWLNLGNYSLSARRRIIDLPANLDAATAIRWADLNGNGTLDLISADSSAQPRLRTIDVGRLLGCVPRPHLLTTIDNGLGREIRLSYEASTKYALTDAASGHPWPHPMPFPVTVVASARIRDWRGQEYVSQFQYHDGYYDAPANEFRGFGRVEQIDPGDATAPILVTRSAFDVGQYDEAMKGNLLRMSAEREDGRVFWSEETAWNTRVLYTGLTGQTVRHAHPRSRTRRILEGGQGVERRLETEFAYDIYGNQTTNADFGIVSGSDRSAFDDERITVTEYALNVAAWIVRLPAREVRMDENGVVSSRTELFYDDETFGAANFGSVSAGNLTLRRQWTDPANPSTGIAVSRTRYDAFGNPQTFLDPLALAPGGNVNPTSGHVREIVYDDRFHAYPLRETIHVGGGRPPLTMEVDYDPGFGKITTSRDFNGNQTVYGYDNFARLIRVIRPGDTEQFPTLEYEYGLGVPAGTNGVVNYIETHRLDKPLMNPSSRLDAYFISRRFIDGLGRTLMTKLEDQSTSGTPRVVVKDAVLFNGRSRVAQTLNAFHTLTTGASLSARLNFEDIAAPGWQGSFHENGQMKTLDFAGAHRTTTEYDATLRPLKVVHQDGSARRTVHEPLLKQTYDENDVNPASPHFDTPVVHQQDGLGRQIRIEETTRLSDDGRPGQELRTWRTQFVYDANDCLIRVTDSQNNVKQLTHDALGRLTFINDPDRGVMHFVYDAASNLIETRDAKDQRITRGYDGVNRILTEDLHDGQALPLWRAANSPAEVVYHYDAAMPGLELGDGTTATARNTKGFLAWVEDLSGEEHTSFDARGRIEYVVKRIADPVHQKLLGFTTRSTHDSADRLVRLIYPDQDEVTYEYNDRTLLRAIRGGPSGSVIPNISYLPGGQKEIVENGNGVRTRYRYDVRQRLIELETLGPQPGKELIHFGYQFDGAGNILGIHDRRPGAEAPAGEARRNTQIFQYDDLHRMTRVQFSFNLPGQSVRDDGGIDYRYDRIGNLLSQTSNLQHEENGLPVANLGEMQTGGSLGRFNRVGRAAQDSPGPHALTSVQGRQVTCDANGNMTRLNGLDCTWDFKDRLRLIENTAMRADYTYDYMDRRVRKHAAWKPGANPQPKSPSFDALFINKYFEVRDAEQAIKYIWDGETRIATVTGSLSPNARVQRIRIFPGWNLISLAVGSTNTVAQLQRTPGVSAIYRWAPQSNQYSQVAVGDNLPAGTVLWLRAAAADTVSVQGSYSEPSAVAANGPGYYPVPGLQALQTGSALPMDANLAWFDDALQRWRFHSGNPTGLVAELPEAMAAGKAVFVHATGPREVSAPMASLGIRYYHGDHLGSASVMSDAQGNLLEETAYYPFGAARLRTRSSTAAAQEPYQFTSKEQDRESDLYNFEARMVAPTLSRFLRPDPKYAMAVRPPPTAQHLNLYAYSLNNPMRFMDPSGLDPKPVDPNESEFAKGADKAKDVASKNNQPDPRAEAEQILEALAAGARVLVNIYAAATSGEQPDFGAIALSVIREIPVSLEFDLKLEGNAGDKKNKKHSSSKNPKSPEVAVSLKFGFKQNKQDGKPTLDPTKFGTLLDKTAPPDALPKFLESLLPKSSNDDESTESPKFGIKLKIGY